MVRSKALWVDKAHCSNSCQSIEHLITSLRCIRWILTNVEACNEFAGLISISMSLQATQLLSKTSRSGGETLATLCPIWPVPEIEFRTHSNEVYFIFTIYCFYIYKWRLYLQSIAFFSLTRVKYDTWTIRQPGLRGVVVRTCIWQVLSKYIWQVRALCFRFKVRAAMPAWEIVINRSTKNGYTS